MNMQTTADFVVHAPDDSIRLVVEAKIYSNESPEWAATYRNNVLTYGGAPQAPYFLLASPHHFYLWKDAPVTAEALPDYQIDAQALLPAYLRDFSVPLNHLSVVGWEFVVAAWLDDLVGGPLPPELPLPVQQWLVDSGLYDAVRDGRVTSQITA
jgi:hypothetical protein